MNQSIAKVLNNKLILVVVSVFVGFGVGTLGNMLLWLVGVSYNFGFMGDMLIVALIAGWFFFSIGEKAELQCKQN